MYEEREDGTKDEEPTLVEAKDIIQKTKSGKTPVEDRVIMGLIKPGGETVHKGILLSMIRNRRVVEGRKL